MKKAVYLLSLLFIAFTSCSNDDDDAQTLTPMNPDTLLLQKSVVANNSINNGAPVTTLWYYSGAKLTSTADSNGMRRVYSYTNNLITEMVETLDSQTVTTIYAYDAQQRLTSATATNQTETFSYNTDGTVTHVLTNANNAVRWTATIYFTGSDITRIVRNYPDGFTTTYEYAYDNKYSPTKNIVGFDQLKLLQSNINAAGKNIISREYADSDGTNGHVARTISFNAIGFPVAIHSVDDQLIDSFDAQFFYQ